jgi:uncharacterized protein
METQKEKLFKTLSLFAIVMTLFVVVKGVNEIRESKFIGGGTVPQSTITISGEGEVFAVPDIAMFSFGVDEEAGTVAKAQDGAAKKINAALAFLKDSGVKEKDIKTTNYSVYPRYEFRREEIVCITFPCPQPPGERVLIGYQVSQNVSVKVRDVDEAGEILSGIGVLGVTNVSGLSFSVDDEDVLQREARQMAIEDAQDKAKELARDLGVRLVRIVSFSESGSQPYPRFFAENAALGKGGDALVVPDIPVGENKIVSRVSISYEIR